MKIDEVLQQAKENRTTDQLDAFLENYEVLINHLDSEDVYIEYLLGDYYLEASGHKDKTMRHRNPPEHPQTVLAEYIDMVLGTTAREFPKVFSQWIEKVGKEAAMMACVKFLNGGKNDLSLMEFDLKTIKALENFDAEPAYRCLDQVMKENDKHIWGVGARSRKHTQAAIKTLEYLDTPRALQSLLRFQHYARYVKPDKSIRILMFDLKLSEAELEELKTPTYNFDENLTRVETFGDFTVRMKLLPDYQMEQKIIDAEGKEYSDFPKEGLEQYKDSVKELKVLKKQIFQDLRRYRDRIDNTYRTGQTWKYPDWLRSHILHPLVAYSARRLIWEFTHETNQRLTGMWSATEPVDPDSGPKVTFLDATGSPLPELDDKWTVKLWHPVEANHEEREAWKDRIMDLRVVQPFKQAFRETYTVTPPELITGTFTNRFAAHILYKQQFASIAASRGWNVPDYYSGFYDAHNDLPNVSIQEHYVTFHMDAEYRHGTNASTDRIVFDNDVELISLPPIVFSEALRDVDMFVSVSSIGVDPTWTPDREGYTYWSQYTTRELSDSALNRKDVLQRILPELLIADKCLIEDRWLFVKGKLCTYKIHIGSGSVHMEPSNQHLCIVPKPAKKSDADTVYLPFESDAMLSLILSKAFLLSNDEKITDRTILQQLRSIDHS